MPAPLTSRTRQLARAQPARAADELSLVTGACATAHGARRWEEEIEQRARGVARATG